MGRRCLGAYCLDRDIFQANALILRHFEGVGTVLGLFAWNMTSASAWKVSVLICVSLLPGSKLRTIHSLCCQANALILAFGVGGSSVLTAFAWIHPPTDKPPYGPRPQATEKCQELEPPIGAEKSLVMLKTHFSRLRGFDLRRIPVME